MPFKKNNKFGKGRPKGSTNKSNEIFKNRVQELLTKLDATLDEDLQQLTPQERVKMYLQLLEYVTPKLKRIEQQEPRTEDEKIEIVVIDPKDKLK